MCSETLRRRRHDHHSSRELVGGGGGGSGEAADEGSRAYGTGFGLIAKPTEVHVIRGDKVPMATCEIDADRLLIGTLTLAALGVIVGCSGQSARRAGEFCLRPFRGVQGYPSLGVRVPHP